MHTRELYIHSQAWLALALFREAHWRIFVLTENYMGNVSVYAMEHVHV